LDKHLLTLASHKKSLNELTAMKTPIPAIAKMAEVFGIVLTGIKKSWVDI
jgi:hypothetical protein